MRRVYGLPRSTLGPVSETSKTADQALRILTAVIERGPASAQELARELDINRTACHRLLGTLHARGFLRKEGSSYGVGHVFLRLAQEALPALLVRARPVLRDFAAAHGETVLLSVVDGDDAVAIDQAVGDGHPIRVAYPLGGRHSLATGASGRALLAYLPAAQVDRVAAGVADPERLATQLDQVRRDGYCTSHDELHANVFAASVPVLADGAPLASLAVVAPKERAAEVEQLVPELRRAAAAILDALH